MLDVKLMHRSMHKRGRYTAAACTSAFDTQQQHAYVYLIYSLSMHNGKEFTAAAGVCLVGVKAHRAQATYFSVTHTILKHGNAAALSTDRTQTSH